MTAVRVGLAQGVWKARRRAVETTLHGAAAASRARR